MESGIRSLSFETVEGREAGFDSFFVGEVILFICQQLTVSVDLHYTAGINGRRLGPERNGRRPGPERSGRRPGPERNRRRSGIKPMLAVIQLHAWCGPGRNNSRRPRDAYEGFGLLRVLVHCIAIMMSILWPSHVRSLVSSPEGRVSSYAGPASSDDKKR